MSLFGITDECVRPNQMKKKLREAGISIGRTSFLFYFFFEGEYKKKKKGNVSKRKNFLCSIPKWIELRCRGGRAEDT
jgi:hypothetical protein